MPETKTENMWKFYATTTRPINQVYENQCVGLNEECCETIFCIPICGMDDGQTSKTQYFRGLRIQQFYSALVSHPTFDLLQKGLFHICYSFLRRLLWSLQTHYAAAKECMLHQHHFHVTNHRATSLETKTAHFRLLVQFIALVISIFAENISYILRYFKLLHRCIS